MATYQYMPLDGGLEKRMIRLIKLFPSSDPTAPIRCVIFHAQLGTSPYEAVSYCWGESTASNTILCNGAMFSVGTNLFDVLTHFRGWNEHEAPRILWVDAICINQRDFDEKCIQIQMMQDIYAQAERALIWLGQEDDKSHRGFIFARGILELYEPWTIEDLLKPSLTSSLLADELIAIKKRRINDYALSEHRGLTAMFSFTRRKWFTRVWIIQEVAVSKSAIVNCGSDQMPWEHFSFAVKACSALFTPRQRPVWSELGTGLIAAIDESRASVQHGRPPSLSQALLRHRAAESTNPLDHIFAMMGFTSVNKLPRRDRLEPNYYLDIGTACRKATIHCMETEISLDILGALKERRESKNIEFPSWVPNWAEFDHKCIPLEVSSFGLSRRFSCSRNSTPEIRISGDETILTLSAQRLDMIDTLSTSLPGEHRYGQGGLTYTESDSISWRDMCNWIQIAYPSELYFTGETAQDAMESTVLAGDRFSQEVSDSASKQTFDSLWGWYRYAVQLNRSLGIPIPITFINSVMFLSKSSIDVLNREMGTYARGRRIARTLGGYLALVPDSTETGDHVVLLKGASIPYVIRKCGDDMWNIVGGAYVHGIMKGEVFDEQKCSLIRFT